MAEPQSDANRTRVGIVEETTFGTIPTNPTFNTLRVTSSSLAYAPSTVSSNELRSDRQVPDLILVGAEASGDIGMEVSFKAQDLLFEGAFFNTFTKTPEIENSAADTEITDVISASSTFQVASGGTAFVTGMLVNTTGFTNSANNLLFRVSSSTATTVVGSSLTLTDEAAPPKGARLKVVGAEGAAGDIAATSTPALTSTALDFTTLGLAVGMWIKIAGFTSATANNDYVRISAISANQLTFDVTPSGWTADTGASQTIQMYFGDYIRNGVTDKSFTIETAYLDNGEFLYSSGMKVDSMSINFDTQAIVTSTVNFQGSKGVYQSTQVTGATNVSAPTNDVLNTSSNVGRVGENGTPVAGPNFINSATIEIANNLRQQNAIGSLGAVGIGAGRCVVTGNINTYFGDKTLVEKAINNTDSSLDFRIGDNNGQVMLIDMPRVKFATAETPVSGIDTDIFADLSYQAIMDSVKGYQIQLQKFEVVN